CYGWTGDGHSIVIVRNERGVAKLARVYVSSGVISQIDSFAEYTDFNQQRVSGNRIAVAASSGVRPARIVVGDLEAHRTAEIIVKRSTSESISPEEFIEPQPISWRDPEGAEIHGLLYSTKREGMFGLPP